jgi:hypothetical protein
LKSGARGIALISCLLLMTILLMMVGASTTRFFGERSLAIGSQSWLAAHYAAQAGLSVALSELSQNPAWAGNVSATLSQGASYRIAFGPGASVNNLANDSPTDGPRGTGSVRARSVYLVIEGQHGLHQRRLEAVVVKGLPGMISRSAIRASGNITLAGSVTVNGVLSVSNASTIPADLISNSGANEAGLVRWLGGGAANIDGAVRTVSNATGAIDFSGGNISQGLRPGSPSQELPKPNIPSLVTSHSGDAPLSLSPGTTNLSAGNHFQSGPVNYVGDLVLNDSNLYIDGPLNISGSVRGTGTLVVSGKTSIYGDALVQSKEGQQVSLLSQGSVTLKGYNGSQKLRSLNITAATQLENTLGLVEAALKAGNPSPFYNGGPNDNLAADVRASVNTLRAALASEPSSPEKDFLTKRLDLLTTPSNGGLFDWPLGGDSGPGPRPQDPILDGFVSDGKPRAGLYDAFHDRLPQRPGAQQLAIMNQFLQLVQGLNFQSPGSAAFVGQVYSNGSIYTENDLTVVGSLQAVDNGSQSPSIAFGSTTVRPGELYLNNSTRVTYVESQAEALGSTTDSMSVLMVFEP